MSLFGKRRDQVDSQDTADGKAPARPATTSGSRPATPPPPGVRPAAPRSEPRSSRSGEKAQTTGGSTSPTKGGAVATIGKSIQFKGELTGDEDLEIDGNVEGDVKLPNHILKIGPHGQVKASVIAKCVQIVGHIAGNVTATERVEVEASGVVEGDIRAPKLLVQEGAVINGAIEMTKGQVAAGRPPASGESGSPEPARKAG